MLLFSGQTRALAHAARLLEAGIGECTLRGELPPVRAPWFYDPGSFRDHLDGQPFDGFTFRRDMRRIQLWMAGGIPMYGSARLPAYERRLLPAPQFIVLPDIVGDGPASLAFSASYLTGPDAPDDGYPPGVPLYLVVQDGMTDADVVDFVARHMHLGVAGLFVGGTMPWKLRTGAAWCALGRLLGIPVHIGRAMSMERLAWAKRIGAASCDGNAPNWHREAAERVERVMADTQRELFAEVACSRSDDARFCLPRTV